MRLWQLLIMMGLLGFYHLGIAEDASAPPAESEPKTDEAEQSPAAEPAKPPVPRTALLDRNDALALNLAQQFPAQVQKLKALEEEFLAFWLPAADPKPKGTLILLPGAGETPDWPRVIGPIRRELPQYAWHTLSVTLPELDSGIPNRPKPKPLPEPTNPESAAEEGQKEEATPPAEAEPPAETAKEAPETEAAEPATEPSADEPPPKPLPPITERIDARIEAALGFARAQGAPLIILLGHGTSGYWAARYLTEEKPELPQHLLLISATRPSTQEVALDELLSRHPVATGDFYYPERLSEQQEAKARLNTSRRTGHTAYTQTALKLIPGDLASEQEQLVRRVRGWLDRQGQ